MSSLSSPFYHRTISLRRVLYSRDRKEGYLFAENSSFDPSLHNNQLAIDEHTCATTSNTIRILHKSNRAACDKMAVVQLLRFQEICIVLQLLLLLLPLQLLHASPCPTIVQQTVVATTLDADNLAKDLLCEGPGRFAVSWNGDVVLSRTLSVSNGTHLNVTGSSESKGAIIISDGTVRLLEVDLGSTVLLTGLTFSGGDGAVRVAGQSLVKVIDCSFLHNKRTSSENGGKPAVLLLLCMSPRKHSEQSKNKRAKLPTLKHTWVLILVILILITAPACSFETLT